MNYKPIRDFLLKDGDSKSSIIYQQRSALPKAILYKIQENMYETLLKDKTVSELDRSRFIIYFQLVFPWSNMLDPENKIKNHSCFNYLSDLTDVNIQELVDIMLKNIKPALLQTEKEYFVPNFGMENKMKKLFKDIDDVKESDLVEYCELYKDFYTFKKVKSPFIPKSITKALLEKPLKDLNPNSSKQKKEFISYALYIILETTLEQVHNHLFFDIDHFRFNELIDYKTLYIKNKQETEKILKKTFKNNDLSLAQNSNLLHDILLERIETIAKQHINFFIEELKDLYHTIDDKIWDEIENIVKGCLYKIKHLQIKSHSIYLKEPEKKIKKWTR